jgi:hypothetical protein
MKKLLLAACFTFALGTLGPASAAAGPSWPFHRHHKDPAAAQPSHSEKSKKSWLHRGKSQDKAREQSARTVGARRSRRRRFSRPQVRGLAPPDPGPSRRRRLLASLPRQAAYSLYLLHLRPIPPLSRDDQLRSLPPSCRIPTHLSTVPAVPHNRQKAVYSPVCLI